VRDPTNIAYYICFGQVGTTLSELVRVAGSRWSIEECFQTTKNETGLDHYQVRRHEAWYRHIALSMAAAAFLCVTREVAKKRGRSVSGDAKMIPLTANEIRRLFNRITAPIRHPIEHVLSRPRWRRTSQARARDSHYRRHYLNLSLQY
jgi:hypothetical protein